MNGSNVALNLAAKSDYRLADDTIDRDDVEDLIAWLRTNPWLTQGELVRRFEREWAAWLGTKHALFVNSGSSANLLMYYGLLASERLPNKKVIVPAVSWATTVAPALQFGFEPIMCEVDPLTFGIDANYLEDRCKRHHPSAVILVHVLGTPCDMEPILALQKRYGFALMEDACAATGSTYDGRKVGTFGDVSAFSFFFGHHLSTIEGGMVCTDDDALHHIILQLRSHGWGKDLPPDVEAAQAAAHGVDGFNRPFTFYYPAFNLRSTDLNARIGLSQLRKLENVIHRRRENHAIYRAYVDASADFECQMNPRASTCSIAFCALARNAAHREEVTRRLAMRRIETRPLGGGNMSRQPFWRAHYPAYDFPVADRIAATAFQLPNHPAHSAEDIRHICECLVE